MTTTSTSTVTKEKQAATVAHLLREVALPATTRKAGRRATLITKRPDGKYGRRRPRTREEHEMVSVNQRMRATFADRGFWAVARTLPGSDDSGLPKRGRPTHQPVWVMFAIACLATQTGSQRSAIAFITDPGQWGFIAAYAQLHKPAEFRSADSRPPTRNEFTHFMRKWASPEWADYRENAEKAGRGYALNAAKRLGHFNPSQALEYANVDTKQWVTLDGTVYQAPTKKMREDGGRYDPASGWHAKGGAPKGIAYGSKYSIVETLSDEYQEQLVLSYLHVEPRPGNSQGDEAGASTLLLKQLKRDAPGLRGAVSDSALRGTHIQELLRIGLITLNHPVAKANPNRLVGGRNAKGRKERTHKIRTVVHEGANKVKCRHTIFLHGSNPCVEEMDAAGNKILTPLVPTGYDERVNKNGSHVYYLEALIECRRGNLNILIRLDQPGRVDVKNQSRADLARFYPVGSPQFDYLYGRRNTSESFHAKMKRTMPRLPAYGRVRQDLFMLGYMVANNAIALAFTARRHGAPNALDFTT